MFIYCLIHEPSQRCYFGITQNLERRLADHRRNGGKGTKLKRAIRKYGWKVFRVETYRLPDREAACAAEQYWIAEGRRLGVDLFNLTSGGDSGFAMADETKAQLRASTAAWCRDRRDPIAWRKAAQAGWTADARKRASEIHSARVGRDVSNMLAADLTPRQREIVEAVIREGSVRRAAAALGLKRQGVRSCLRKIDCKLSGRRVR